MPMKPRVFGAEKRAEASRGRERDRNKRPQKAIYNSKAWALQRVRVFVRDLYICQDCGKLVGIEPGDAHCDHIEPLTEARHVTDDELQVLCIECHTRKTNEERLAGKL